MVWAWQGPSSHWLVVGCFVFYIALYSFVLVSCKCPSLLTDRSGVLKTAECYDIRKYCWEAKTSLSQPRKHCAAVFFDGMVYVAGGIGMDGQDLTLVEKYDQSTSRWTTVASLNECKGLLFFSTGRSAI